MAAKENPREPRRQTQEQLDKSLEDTFPASDPTALQTPHRTGGTHRDGEARRNRQESQRSAKPDEELLPPEKPA